MSPLKTLVLTLLSAPLLWASIGEITVIKGDAYVKRTFVLPERQDDKESNATLPVDSNTTLPSDTNTTASNENNITETADQNQSVSAPGTEVREINATVGMSLEEGDIVLTRAKTAQARIKMSDGTLITVGGNSELKIEAFNTETNDASFDLAQGTLRTITGQIGKIAPDRFKIKTKTATMGIRGTDFITALGAQGAVDAACLEGAISVTTGAGAVTVPAGQIASALPGAIPSAPVALSAAVLGTLFGALSLDDDEVAAETERFAPPPPPAEENNETNTTEPAPIIPPVAGNLTVKAGHVELARAQELPGFSDENRTLLEGDKLRFTKAGTLELLNGASLQAGKKAELTLNVIDANASKTPVALLKGAFVATGETRLMADGSEIALDGRGKALILIDGKKTTVVSLEGSVMAKTLSIGNLMLTENGTEPRAYEAKELIELFEAAGLEETDAKPYLPKPKAPPKPKIYKF